MVLKINYILICFEILCCKQEYFCINTAEILEYTQIILMLFGVTQACNMGSHFGFRKLLEDFRKFLNTFILMFWFSLLAGEPATCTSKHLCFTWYSVSVVDFHTASLASSCLLSLIIYTFCYRILQHT